MAVIDITIQGGSLYVHVPVEYEFQALQRLQVLFDNLRALVEIIDHGTIEIRVGKEAGK